MFPLTIRGDMDVEFLIIAAFLGLIPAFIAQSKGRSFGLWWLYGFLLFIIALIHSLCISGSREEIENRQLEQGMARCPFCAELIRSEAIKCKHCGSDVGGHIESKIESNFCVRHIDNTTLYLKRGSSLYINDDAVKILVKNMKENSRSTNPGHVFGEYQEDLNYVSYLLPSSLQSEFIKKVKYWLDRMR